MKSEIPHPFSIDVEPSAKSDGKYEWAIRKRGKLMERSDRIYPDEGKAYAGAVNALERSLKPGAF